MSLGCQSTFTAYILGNMRYDNIHPICMAVVCKNTDRE